MFWSGGDENRWLTRTVNIMGGGTLGAEGNFRGKSKFSRSHVSREPEGWREPIPREGGAVTS